MTNDMCCPRIHFTLSKCVIISPLRTLSNYFNDPTSNRFHDEKQFDKFNDIYDNNPGPLLVI